ncbi:MAG: hypothetical protein HKP25_01490, partial [Marinicaulis sp.]|nr:hypothetical protein [Marinicaulis sp.]
FDTGAGPLTDVNEFLERQQATTNVIAETGDPGFSDLNARPFWFNIASSNPGDILRFGDRDPNEFALYDEFNPRRKIVLDFATAAVIEAYDDATTTTPPVGSIQFLLNFDPSEGELDQIEVESDDVPNGEGPTGDGNLYNDGDDVLFGDLGNDWIVGGTGRDHAYGGRGSDLLNMDDDHDSGAASPNNPNKGINNQIENTLSDEAQAYADIFYGGAGRDVLILNTGADRSIDWVGEFNSYIVPFSPFGAFHISRTLQPQLEDYLEALSDSDGADVSATPSDDPLILPSVVDAQLYVEQKLFDVRTDDPDPDRNYAPFGELGMVRQEDRDWGDQTGAPDDPQPGNFQGKREIMRRELFNDTEQVLFADITGDFETIAGKFVATPDFVGDQAKSVFHLDATIGNYVEILVTANLDKPTGGYFSNGYIIFDYQNEFDYKFAGINDKTNKIEIGHYDENGWQVDHQSNMQIKHGKDYDITVALHGMITIINVNGTHETSHVFSDALKDGLVGLGTENAVARFDNYQVQQLPPTVTLTETDDFSGASSFISETGDWDVDGDRLNGVPTGGSPAAVALREFDVQVFSRIWIEAVVSTDGAGGVVFDKSDASGAYKFAAIDADNDLLLIGHVQNGSVSVDAEYDFNVVSGRDYDLKVSLIGGSVSVEIDGTVVGGHVFNSVLNDGTLGAMSLEGSTSFDEITLKTDDPQYAEPEALTAGESIAAGAASADLLSADALADAIDTAKTYWLSTGVSAEQLDAISADDFIIADLHGDFLGQHLANGSILIDANAAGFGWGADGFNLVTVVTHEIGHALGFDHGDPGFGEVGFAELTVGEHPVVHNQIEMVGAASNEPAPADSLENLVGNIPGIDTKALTDAMFTEANREAMGQNVTLVLDSDNGVLTVQDRVLEAMERRWDRNDFVDLLSDDFDFERAPNQIARPDAGGNLANNSGIQTLIERILAAATQSGL